MAPDRLASPHRGHSRAVLPGHSPVDPGLTHLAEVRAFPQWPRVPEREDTAIGFVGPGFVRLVLWAGKPDTFRTLPPFQRFSSGGKSWPNGSILLSLLQPPSA